MSRVKPEKPRGILNVPPEVARRGVARYWPAEDLAPFIEHFWIVRWDLIEPQIVETVPHPSVHMVMDTTGPAEIAGVMDRKFTRTLEGRGRVVGTKFRPGAFRAFVKQSVANFSNRRLPIGDVFGTSARGLRERVLETEDDLASIAIIEPYLRSLRPRLDDSITLAGRVAARIAEDRSLTRVDQIVTEFAMPLRQLQRLFKEYVGVSPKWIIQRYRLLEAAERMAEDAIPAWADLALDLGYADQAHFIRDFKRFVGRTPAHYAGQLSLPAHRTQR